ncbi:MAG: class I SAM-dependent methyltransferase [Acidobacteria bacterium]|nr:class I SAM-dependent methyltransferase [Acidobacteriota bacterium]
MNRESGFAELLAPHVGGEVADRLVLYAELLERWAGKHSLVSFVDRKELVERHILEALAAEPCLGRTGRLLDVGSGAGLPGVPLLAARPEWGGVFLEPRQKRWAFLRLVIRELGLKARADRTRYQELPPGESWDLLTIRAVGGYDELLPWARARLAPGGEVLLWTTDEEERGLRGDARWRVLSSPLPGLDRGRLIRLQPCFT